MRAWDVWDVEWSGMWKRKMKKELRVRKAEAQVH